MAAPRFGINNVVYLVESAKAGQVESYKVVQVRQDGDGIWYYTLAVPSRPPPTVLTLTDRNTGKLAVQWEVPQSELTDVCTALGYAESYHQEQLAKIQAFKSQYCGTG